MADGKEQTNQEVLSKEQRALELATKGEEKPLILQISMDDAEKIVQEVAKQIEIRNKVWKLCINLTNPHDWALENGEPFLQFTGSSKLRERFGVNIRMEDPVSTKLRDDGGEYVMITLKGTAEFSGKKIEDFGTCSTRDKLFGKGKRLEEVDMTNVLKKAATNLQNRLLKKVLGFFPTLEDLQAGGMDVSKIAKVEYRSSGAQPTDEEKVKQTKIMTMLNEVYAGDTKKIGDWLEKLTAFKGKDDTMVAGIRDPKLLKGKRLEIAMPKIEKSYEDWKKEIAATGESRGI